ncbi:uncharacterized protein LOC120344080 [Styela clava]
MNIFKSSKNEAKRHKKHRPIFSFHPSTFAFEIDNQDENFKRGLRRKSLTGQAPHSISRQISGGKVNIPVEKLEDSISEQIRETERVTVPESIECENNAKRDKHPPSVPKKSQTQRPSTQKRIPIPVQHEPGPYGKLHASLHEGTQTNTRISTQKNSHSSVTPVASQGHGKFPYDPKKYEEQKSVKDKVPSNNRDNVQTAEKVSKHNVEENLKNLAIQKNTISEQKEEKSANPALQQEHEIEILEQDKFIAKEYKLHRFLIIPDGNCLYRAVAQAILLDQSQHMLLRQLTVDHIREHQDVFENIIEGNVDEFLMTAMLEGEWAGYPEILALTCLLDININITTGGTKSNPTVHTTLHYFEPDHQKEADHKKLKKEKSDKYTERQSIWLSWLSNGHYDTFTDAQIENPCYEEWLKSRETRLENDAAMANQMYDADINKRDYENLMRYRQSEGSSCPAYSNTAGNSQTLPSTSYQNNDFSNIDLSNINNVLTNSLDSTLPPHRYPSATYSTSPRNVSPNRNEEAPPPYSSLGITTELDEAIARSLQAEEDEHQDFLYA